MIYIPKRLLPRGDVVNDLKNCGFTWDNMDPNVIVNISLPRKWNVQEVRPFFSSDNDVSWFIVNEQKDKKFFITEMGNQHYIISPTNTPSSTIERSK